MILLDTNVVVHFLRGDAKIAAAILSTPRTELALPAIVVYELEYGTLRSKVPDRRRRELAKGLASIQQVPFGSDAAIAAATIRVELESKGQTIGPLDLMIAGTARSCGATLVTNNTVEFSRVPGLRLLDWRTG